MRYHYAIIFLFIFNGVVPLVSGWGVFGSAQASNYAPWTLSVIQTTYGCNTNASSINASQACKVPTPNGSFLGNLISGFGDWLDAMTNYVFAFAVGVFLPQIYLVNVFHLTLAWAIVISAPMYILYASFFSYFFGFRSPESGT